MNKKPFVTKEQIEEIAKTYPTPFHLYDEKGIRENAKRVKEAFSWNPGFREYFAIKATPNPFLVDILREYGCGCDCSSETELMLCDAIGAKGEEIRSIIDDINEVTGALAANSERIDNTMANIENVSGALAEADLSQTVAKLNGAIDELTATLAAVNSTEGSIGLLMNDRALYDSLAEASANLSSLLEDLQNNPKRYVHFSLFGGGKNK